MEENLIVRNKFSSKPANEVLIMVKNVLNWIELLDKHKDYISCATEFPNDSKEICCNNYKFAKHDTTNIVKKKEANVIEKIRLLKNQIILREILAAENNKKVVLIYEAGRNKNNTNNNEKYNETCRNNLLNDNFDKSTELIKEIDQTTNLPKKIAQPNNKTSELTKEID